MNAVYFFNVLGGIDNLPSQAREGALNQINYSAATGLVNQLFSDETLTERQLNHETQFCQSLSLACLKARQCVNVAEQLR